MVMVHEMTPGLPARLLRRADISAGRLLRGDVTIVNNMTAEALTTLDWTIAVSIIVEAYIAYSAVRAVEDLAVPQ